MPFKGDLNPEFLKQINLKVTEDKIKYLGVVIPKDPNLIYKVNYLDMIEKLKRNIEIWRVLPLSMIGRVNAIKMVTLPRFLYLFRICLYCLSKAFFKSLDSIILTFVWGCKVYCI